MVENIDCETIKFDISARYNQIHSQISASPKRRKARRPILEYTASDVQAMLQEMFPRRKLVLSQLTLFNQNGVCQPTGVTFRRGRRCYRIQDLLPTICVLVLKEEGIPFKNIASVPQLVRDHADLILNQSSKARCSVRLAGCGDVVSLMISGDSSDMAALNSLLDTPSSTNANLFWSCDVAALGHRLLQTAYSRQEQRAVAA